AVGRDPRQSKPVAGHFDHAGCFSRRQGSKDRRGGLGGQVEGGGRAWRRPLGFGSLWGIVACSKSQQRGGGDQSEHERVGGDQTATRPLFSSLPVGGGHGLIPPPATQPPR